MARRAGRIIVPSVKMRVSLVHSVHASLHMQHFCVSSVMSMMFEVSLGDEYAISDAPTRYIDLSSRLCLHVECYV